MMKRVANTMTLGRFKTLVESYGARAAAWPEDERDMAIALLKTSAKAKTIAAVAAGLDNAFDMLAKPATADDAFIRRLETIPHASTPPTFANPAPDTFAGFLKGLFATRALLPQGLGVAAAGLIGVWLGFSATAETQQIVTLDAAKLVMSENDLQDDLWMVE